MDVPLIMKCTNLILGLLRIYFWGSKEVYVWKIFVAIHCCTLNIDVICTSDCTQYATETLNNQQSLNIPFMKRNFKQ